ncbi:amino Acid/Auxin permease family [Corchorus olitorius]|uniref:Amino Acid/Auxin permease family n=1 Tax=Corchorus olitorius TaxID=93759 RepID=A0A1R3GE78_9ROSI|nr:amino Acid/Auxin permease family [Corchorus olitorius]
MAASYRVQTKQEARLMLLRAMMIRMQHHGVKKVWFKETARTWAPILEGRTRVEWRMKPAQEDVLTLINTFDCVGIIRGQHQLARETKKMVDKAASTRTSFTWP